MNDFDLDTTIIEFQTPYGSCPFTIRHAVTGISCLGSLGSGKTSGSGRMIALKYLQYGFGGLVLTAKPDERELWEEYCALTNRTSELIIVEPEPAGKYHFNFLSYEFEKSLTKEVTENIVQVLKTVIRAGEEKSSGKSDDPFWEAAMDLLLFNVIDLCRLAYNKLSIQDMSDIVLSIPKEKSIVTKKEITKDKTDKSNNKEKPEEEEKETETAYTKAFEKAKKNALKQVDEWSSQLSFETFTELNKTDTLFDRAKESVADFRLLLTLDDFFSEQYVSLSEKTRSIIDFSFSSFLFRLLRDPIYSIFCKNESNFTPDDCLKGKIILLDFPVKRYHKIGRDIQIMFKYIWQRAMEKRNVKENQRPVFLFADEAQNFIHEHDVEYQATARSSRIATVYLSQNLSNYFSNMGGSKAEHRVKSFMGTLGTKIFHANADIETNIYASNLIGENLFESHSQTTTRGESYSQSDAISPVMMKMVRPEDFIKLRTGGPKFNYAVDAIVHYQGQLFSNGRGYAKIAFNQNCIP